MEEVHSTDRLSPDAKKKDARLLELQAFAHQSRILQNWVPVSYVDKGTYSRIFRVVNRHSGQEAVLKFVPNPLDERDCCERDSSEELFHRSRFEASKREAEIMHRLLGEENIVQYLETPEYLTRTFRGYQGEEVVQYAVLICMPLYMNHNQWISQVAGNRDRLIRLGMDIAHALMVFEQKGIFHRDIKPGNILMDRDGRFRLGDVGEAKMESEQETVGFHGTRTYMAPEVYRQENRHTRMRSDHRSDLYSLGIVLYRLFNHLQFPFLTARGELIPEAQKVLARYRRKKGYDDFEGMRPGELAHALRYEGRALPPPAEADAQLARVILRACAYSKKARYQTAEAFYHALEACLNQPGRGITGRPQSFEQLVHTVLLSCEPVLAVLRPVFDKLKPMARKALGVFGALPQLVRPVWKRFAQKAAALPQKLRRPRKKQAEAVPVQAMVDDEATVNQDTVAPDPRQWEAPAVNAAPPEPEIETPLAAEPQEPDILLNPEAAQALYQQLFSALPDMPERKPEETKPEAPAEEPPAQRAVPEEVQRELDRVLGRTQPKQPVAPEPEKPESQAQTTARKPRRKAGWLRIAALLAPCLLALCSWVAADYLQSHVNVNGVQMELTDSDTWMVVDVDSASRRVTIPRTWKDKPVTEIGVGAFWGKWTLASVTLPDTLRVIHSQAFGHSGLREIVIPYGVTTIADEAFVNAEYLTTVIIPPTVEIIGKDAFKNCSKADLRVAENSRAHHYMIRNKLPCSILQPADLALTLPGTFITAEGIALEQTKNASWRIVSVNSGAETLELPGEVNGLPVTEIGSLDLHNCPRLRELTVPAAIETVDVLAFKSWKAQNRTLHAPPGSPAIAQAVHDGVSVYVSGVARELTTEDGLRAVQSGSAGWIIAGCDQEKDKLTLPDTILGLPVTAIGKGAFSGCEWLKSITLSQSLTAIGEEAFANCTRLKSAALPDGLVSIGRNAFFNCNALGRVNLGAAVARIDGNPFASSSARAYVAEDNPVFSAKNSLLINNQTHTLVACFIREDKQIRVPDGVVTIGEYAFCDRETLQKIVLPESLMFIKHHAFYDCDNLRTLQLPGNVRAIDEYAFALCRNLRTITLPDSLSAIGEYAFSQCARLPSITLPHSVQYLNRGVFEGCKALEEVQAAGSIRRVEEEAFLGCQRLKSFTILRTTAYIGKRAFEGCEALTLTVVQGTNGELYARNNGIPYQTISD